MRYAALNNVSQYPLEILHPYPLPKFSEPLFPAPIQLTCPSYELSDRMADQQKVPHATLHFPLFLPPGLPWSDTVLQEKSAQLSASHIEDSDPHIRKHSSRLITRKMSHFLTTYKNPLVPLAKYRNVIMSHSPLSLAHDLPPSHLEGFMPIPYLQNFSDPRFQCKEMNFYTTRLKSNLHPNLPQKRNWQFLVNLPLFHSFSGSM